METTSELLSDLERNARKLKKWMVMTPKAEIRMGLKQAELEMNLDLTNEGIIELFKQGIFVDVVIRNVNEDDFLPEKLEKKR